MEMENRIMVMNKPPPSASQVKSKVLLLEDHAIVRQGLAMLIDDEPDLMVCGGAETLAQVEALIPELQPDIVVADISLGEENGLDIIKLLRDKHPDLPVLALSMHDEALYAERALRAGAKGYIMKKEAMDKVMTAIRKILSGDVYISDKMASRMVRKLVDPAEATGATPMEKLTDREFEVFSLIAQGIGPSQIAQRLSVSVKTIETHREHIKEKLGLKSGTELTRFALRWTMEER
jgi:DNA-binding NarL/FixJ family response regulator